MYLTVLKQFAQIIANWRHNIYNIILSLSCDIAFYVMACVRIKGKNNNKTQSVADNEE